MAKSSFTQEELLTCGRGEMFGPGNAQLPLPQMLMLDRVAHISSEGGAHGRGQVVGELDIHPDLWFFACHFPGDPVMPGCLGLDALWQMLGFYLAWCGHPGRGRALGVREVKFRGQVRPNAQRVVYTVDVERVAASRLVMAIADGTVSVDGRTIYTANGLKVGLFTSTDDF